MSLVISSEDRSDSVILRVRGEVDLATVPDLDHHLSQNLGQGRAVVVDLSGVSYMDMSGIRVLEQFGRLFRERDHRLVIAAPSQVVQMVMSIIGFDGTPVTTSTKEALDLLRRND